MSLDADAIVDRRRLRRRASFWRGLAILLLAGAAVAGALFSTGDKLDVGQGQIARFAVNGFISGTKPEIDTLKKIADSTRVKALIVRIDSPGGTTAGSEALYLALRKVAEKKPVVAVVGTLAASGGYVTAIATDYIVARRNSLVGSIGVIYQWPEVSELLKTVGVNVNEIKSSPLKASPNPFQPPSEEARRVIEELVGDSYDWFVGLVKDRRGYEFEEAKRIGDGRVFTGGQGLNLKMIDQIGGEEEAVAWLAKERKIDAKLPIRDWKPSDDPFGFDFANEAAVWALNKIGLGGLADFFSPAANPLMRRGATDGLLSLWQAPLTSRATEAVKSAP